MGKKRKRSKSKQVISRAYEAAQSTPLRRAPVGANLSQDNANQQTMGRLLEWARYCDENVPIAISVLDDFVKSVVGKGIVVIPEPMNDDGSIDQELGSELLHRWKRWMRKADVTGELTFNAAQRLMCRAWPRDGEQFYQHVAGRETGYRFENDETPYRIELLESEMVPFDYQDERRGWLQGIQHNGWNQPTNYAVYKRHPGNQGMSAFGSMVSLDDVKIVPADRIVHLKMVSRWPATRGTTLLHGVIATLYDVKDLEESERIKNRNLSNWVAAIIKSPDLIGVETTDDKGRRYHEQFQGMMIDTLAAGESIQGVGPDYPVANMPEHIADQIRRITGGTGTRFSSVSRRFDGNYASQRQELVESVGFSEMRRDDFVAKGPRSIYEMWAFVEFMTGGTMLPAGMDFERAVNAEYRGPAIPWLDPLKETQADIAAIDADIADIDEVRIKRGAPEHMIGKPARRPATAAPAQLRLLPDEEEEEDAA